MIQDRDLWTTVTLRPNPANQLAPRRRMVGDTATVSTLVTVVGQPNTPTLAGKGGFRRGFPWRPCSRKEKEQKIPGIHNVNGYRWNIKIFQDIKIFSQDIIILNNVPRRCRRWRGRGFQARPSLIFLAKIYTTSRDVWTAYIRSQEDIKISRYQDNVHLPRFSLVALMKT